MAKICMLSIIASSNQEEGDSQVYVGNSKIGFLKQDGDFVLTERKDKVEMSSLDLFLLNRESEDLRAAEIKRLQELLRVLRSREES